MKYTSSGFKSVTADNIGQAARIFADRAARRKYGRRAYARTCTMQAHAQDMRLAEFCAFIGYTTPGNPHELTGNNMSFTVFKA